MTDDEIIKMAREAGAWEGTSFIPRQPKIELHGIACMHRFAALVAARAAAEEREACIDLMEEHQWTFDAPRAIRDAIRARGQEVTK